MFGDHLGWVSGEFLKYFYNFVNEFGHKTKF